MLVHSTFLENAAVPLAALGAAFLGSAHCLAMCGGVAAAVGRDIRHVAAYQLGRLTAYATLGAIAGAFGAEILSNGWQSPLAFAAAAAFSVLFFAVGVSLWSGSGRRWPALTRLSARVWEILPGTARRTPIARATAIGLLTPLLPCGWLYGFALLAAGTKSPSVGAAILVALWAGSLPSLVVAPAVMARWRHRLSGSQQKILALVLILVGTFNLATRFESLRNVGKKSSVSSCHHSSTERRNP